MDEPRSQWAEIVERDPSHSQRYIDRFAMLAAQGQDLLGEARVVDAVSPRRAAILDAGCGPGRHAGELARLGHRVTGVDLDPVLIASAREKNPGPVYGVSDLYRLTLPDGAEPPFDTILCAGNVLGFVHPDTRRPILANLRDVLAPTGRLLCGFGAGRGYDFDDFFADAQASGLAVEQRFSTWDLRPFHDGAGFLVAFLTRA